MIRRLLGWLGTSGLLVALLVASITTGKYLDRVDRACALTNRLHNRIQSVELTVVRLEDAVSDLEHIVQQLRREPESGKGKEKQQQDEMAHHRQRQ